MSKTGSGNRFIYLFRATRPLGQGHPNDRLEGAFGNTFSLLSVEITALRLQIVKTARVSFLKPFEHNTYEASKGIPSLIWQFGDEVHKQPERNFFGPPWFCELQTSPLQIHQQFFMLGISINCVFLSTQTMLWKGGKGATFCVTFNMLKLIWSHIAC